MPVQVTLGQIASLAPDIHSAYREAMILDGQAVFDQFGISGSPLRVAHFIAQVLHESGAMTLQFENLNYSAERLALVWPGRFRPRGPLDPAAYAHNEEKLANAVYAGRLGNVAPGDGFTYRGRGLLQLTGRLAYEQATAVLREKNAPVPDFTEQPDAVLDPLWCLGAAAATWFAKGCNALADADLLDEITLRINGAAFSLPQRLAWLRRTRRVWRQGQQG